MMFISEQVAESLIQIQLSKSENILPTKRELNLHLPIKVTFHSKKQMCLNFSILMTLTKTEAKLLEDFTKSGESTIHLATIETTSVPWHTLLTTLKEAGYQSSIHSLVRA